ncbi:expressed unknown protein [Seminavis robusta]|uniref:Uncharacterized protein n=1 Tax=Seminavis robusta TaxID=568900 RepID=A0A9N8DTC1_9STRA|nr:expressed unknown protein [Seminavis robusta]|eukprot:Sro236_g094960.1 n/a (743) ;mRNA; f:35771-38435
MPFARVGAMPPPSRYDGQVSSAPQQQQQDVGGRPSRRQKGITMEDLKKQTAMRLAQEHHQVPPGVPKTAAVSGDPRTRHPVVTPQTLAARRIAAAAAHAPSTSRDVPVPHYQRLHHQQQHHSSPMVHHIPNTVDPPGMSYGASPQYDQGANINKNPTRHKNPRQAKFAEMQMAEQHQQSINVTSNRFQQEQQRSQYSRPSSAPLLPANPLSSNSSAYNSAAGNLGSGNGQSSSTSKLPHGLTVNELKEMTKARLQAEAADKMSTSTGSAVVEMETRDPSSAGFDAMQSNYGQSMPSLDRSGHVVPSQVHTNSMGFDHGSSFRQPAQVSPIPSSLHGFGQSTSSSSFNDTLAQDPSRTVAGNRGRVDSYPDSNWDNASVTSHNSTVASEYLGSESAFSSGVNGYGQLDDPSAMSLGRTQSYPLGSNGRSTAVSSEMVSRENTPTNSIPSPIGTSYFEPSASAMNQNRQRAMTLSPRPGLSLLHEDRPGFCEDELGIPSFSSGSRHARQQLTARSRRSFSPILQPQAYASDSSLGAGGNYGSNNNLPGGVLGGNIMENRPRTSSTASLPAISHTAEEFALDGHGTSRRSSDNVTMRGPTISEHSAIHSGGDALLGSSSIYGSGVDGRSHQTSSVFRNDYGGIPAPPGLGHDNIGMPGSGHNPLVPRAGSLDGMGSNRVRASTWAAAPASDMFGSSSGLYDYNGDDTLAGDLASILKLSGAEEKPDADRSGMLFSDMPSSFLGRS